MGKKSPRRPARDWEAEHSPTVWFCMLETARNQGDRELESKAMAQLRDLGVEVRFTEVN